jgi:hypothetical protein
VPPLLLRLLLPLLPHPHLSTFPVIPQCCCCCCFLLLRSAAAFCCCC